jgi:hypothetical protein
VEEVELGGDERSGLAVTCPARYVDAVKGLVQEDTELGEGLEDEWLVRGEKEVNWVVGFEAEVE